MEEIKVGEYVRTTDGIKKIVQVNEGKLSTYYGKYIVYPEYKNSKSINIKNILKHSPNIIDLIEVDDIINTKHPAFEKIYCEHVWCEEYLTMLKKFFEEKSIILLSILTKEQYTANCYEVK